MTWILAWLSIFGASWVVADSKISLPVRLWIAGSTLNARFRGWLLDLLECPACLSFWIGLAVAIGILGLRWLAIPFAFASCGISLILFLAVQRLSG